MVLCNTSADLDEIVNNTKAEQGAKWCRQLISNSCSLSGRCQSSSMAACSAAGSNPRLRMLLLPTRPGSAFQEGSCGQRGSLLSGIQITCSPAQAVQQQPRATPFVTPLSLPSLKPGGVRQEVMPSPSGSRVTGTSLATSPQASSCLWAAVYQAEWWATALS